ncbi:hypothetical protein AVEN_47735-1 [Araneus ventricosus]|uniref:Uncharacterized protein n=1 Tax=Araneus ventricosus TaxID=182803 RepID=A0A4Y2N9M3_ARAVE|nr:hypothetical protein AVEN_47735-1 [Araneus ventricosus]
MEFVTGEFLVEQDLRNDAVGHVGGVRLQIHVLTVPAFLAKDLQHSLDFIVNLAFHFQFTESQAFGCLEEEFPLIFP